MTALLADAGVPVVVVARRRERLTELARSHQGIEVLAADLTTKRGCDTVADRLADDDRPIDLLVNNAGFGSSGEFVTIAPNRLDDEISLNVRALTTLSRAVLPGMVERRRGWLLNVSSVAGFQSAPGLAVYAATKAFVTSLSESLHEELRGTGVRVTALCPGLDAHRVPVGEWFGFPRRALPVADVVDGRGRRPYRSRRLRPGAGDLSTRAAVQGSRDDVAAAPAGVRPPDGCAHAAVDPLIRPRRKRVDTTRSTYIGLPTT